MRTLFYGLLTLVVIALMGAFAVQGLGMAQDLQQPGVYRIAQDHVAGVRAAAPDLCGREETRGTIKVRVQCIDYPAIKRLTGATMFPDEKGQQVWVRSTDPTTKAFRISMTYRKGGHLDTVVKYADVHETYDSGAGWVLGDVQVIAVEVTELRESAKAEIR